MVFVLDSEFDIYVGQMLRSEWSDLLENYSAVLSYAVFLCNIGSLMFSLISQVTKNSSFQTISRLPHSSREIRPALTTNLPHDAQLTNVGYNSQARGNALLFIDSVGNSHTRSSYVILTQSENLETYGSSGFSDLFNVLLTCQIPILIG